MDQIILSISARGLTTGETPRIFADVYGATVSKDPISKITVKVLEELTEWRDRPLDKVYPVMFIDAIMVKIRDGLPDSVTTTWPLATVQACVIHLLRNVRREAPVLPIGGGRPTTSGRRSGLMKLGAA